MKCRKVLAVAAAVFATFSFASVVVASDEPTMPVPIMVPGDGFTEIPCAVYFADNMAFGPQWRVGGLVRIELAVINLDADKDGTLLTVDQIPLNISESVNGTIDQLTNETKVYNQVELFTDPSLLNDTYMVSVSHIWVNISLSTDSSHTYRYASDFTDGYDDSDTVGREINKMGHLIYGFLWDTELDAAPVGVYSVSVGFTTVYGVKMAIEHLYPIVNETDDTDDTEAVPTGYTALPFDDGSATSGTGGVATGTNEAYIYLGELILKGGSGSNGSNGGGDGGNGNMNGLMNTAGRKAY
jgi:hypothetical protein